MSCVAAIEALLFRGVPVTLDAIGGRAVVEAEIDELVGAPYLDILVKWAITASPVEEIFFDNLVVKGFEGAQYASTFRIASDLLLASEVLRARVGLRLIRSLEMQAAARSDNRSSLIAAYALETWLRLALGGVVTRFRLLSVLVEIEAEENGLFLEHVAKIVGVAFHAWCDRDLLIVLERLRRNPAASGEATFEYGNALLSIALDGSDQHSLMAGLESARTLFLEADCIDPDRSDAKLYAAVIEVVQGFARNAGESDLQQAFHTLANTAADRAFLLSADRLPDWLIPRWDRDVQWFELLEHIPRIAVELDRPSWLRACEVLDRLLKVYDADRTIAGGIGFGILLRPRIEASFVRSRGLLAHLDDRLRDPDFIGEYRDVAVTLRDRISAIATEPDLLGKQGEDTYIEKLQGVLNDIGAPDVFVNHVIGAAKDKLISESEMANPVVQCIYRDIRSKLSDSPYYIGRFKETFDRLVFQVIRFCMDRQDATKKELGDRGKYLFTKNSLEADFQKDLREFFVGNLTGGAIQTEVEGIAKGRADIYVGHGDWRFLIELKRHEGHVSREVARKYVGQAASYQGTNVKLGMLGILELVDRTDLPSSVEDCIWHDSLVPEGDATVRHLIVFKVPGRLKRPNELSR